MPLTTQTRGYKGRGDFVVKPRGAGRPFLLGNVTTVTEAIEVERDSRQNFRTAAGGELDVTETVSSFTFEATVDDITPRNIALAFAGTAMELATGVVTDEAVSAWPSVPAAFRYIPDPAIAPVVEIAATEAPATDTAYAVGDTVLEGGRGYLCVVAGTSGSSAPSWATDLSRFTDGDVTWKDLGTVALTADTDYTVTPHGVQLLASAEARADGDLAIPLSVDYTRNAQWIIQALVASAEEFGIDWNGLNSVDGGNPATCRYHRVKFSPTSGFSRHGGDDFSTLTISGTVLSDESIEGAGLSQFQELVMI
ncbi:MAG: hypothetical protein AAF662_02305 [Pseudomonadota bacterium]